VNDAELEPDAIFVEPLTRREKDVLALLSGNLSNREIAEQLVVSVNTVKWYVRQIIAKLGVQNRRQAVERARGMGLLEGGQKTMFMPQTKLPAEPTPFVGRLEELEEIKTQLMGTHLLTLTGPGGIGKTRLALRAAAEMADEFEQGIFFVPLAPIGSVEHLIQTIAEAMDYPLATHEDPQHQLLRYLRKRQVLLVMDNYEHLLDGVGIVSEILRAAPAVKVLATSREKLNLQSETNLNVGGMSLPGQEGAEDLLNYDAITLFVQSAGKVRPGYDPAPEELEQIVDICQIVQGMPLAIELAAAWLHMLNVDEIVEELEKGIDILAAEVRDAPERHRSIRAVFNHSWSMLDQTEREILLLLSVFRGGFTREAAQRVGGASLQQLAGLVNKSFLSHDPESGRLVIHELLRQYAGERLEGKPEASVLAQEAHAAYYAEFMQQRWKRLKGYGQMQALAEIEADIENVRAAWRYYLDQRNTAQMWMFIYSLWYIYWIRWWNHAGMELFAEAARVLDGEDDEEALALRALAMAYQGYFMAWLDLSEQGYELGKESVEILQQLNYPEALVFAYDTLGVNAYLLNRYTEEIEAANKMLEIATELDDKWLTAFTLFAMGLGALFQEDYAEARRLAESNLNLNEEIGDVIGSTMSLIILGHVALARGELEMGKIAEAENYLLKGLLITKEIGFVRDIVNLLYEFARLWVAQDKAVEAVELLALVLQHPASHLYRWQEGRIRDSAKGLLAKLENELPRETYTVALERGQGLALDEVIADLVSLKR
jgi:predicted ATPase/DNA-binding CsgD family transcriptional regulator